MFASCDLKLQLQLMVVCLPAIYALSTMLCSVGGCVLCCDVMNAAADEVDEALVVSFHLSGPT